MEKTEYHYCEVCSKPANEDTHFFCFGCGRETDRCRKHTLLSRLGDHLCEPCHDVEVHHFIGHEKIKKIMEED